MNNLRLLAMLAGATLLSAGVCAYAQRIVTLEEIYHLRKHRANSYARQSHRFGKLNEK